MADFLEDSEPRTKRRPPATTPDGRENQMIAMAFDLAEKQLRDGTASAPTINHFLKLGSSRERLEKAKIVADTEVAKKKIEVMASAEQTEKLLNAAVEAMRGYSVPKDDKFDD